MKLNAVTALAIISAFPSVIAAPAPAAEAGWGRPPPTWKRDFEATVRPQNFGGNPSRTWKREAIAEPQGLGGAGGGSHGWKREPESNAEPGWGRGPPGWKRESEADADAEAGRPGGHGW